jgi:hypothetical protein
VCSIWSCWLIGPLFNVFWHYCNILQNWKLDTIFELLEYSSQIFRVQLISSSLMEHVIWQQWVIIKLNSYLALGMMLHVNITCCMCPSYLFDADKFNNHVVYTNLFHSKWSNVTLQSCHRNYECAQIKIKYKIQMACNFMTLWLCFILSTHFLRSPWNIIILFWSI